MEGRENQPSEAMGGGLPREDTAEEYFIGLDQIYGILRNSRRRAVIKILQDTDGPISLGEVAQEIAASENGKEPRLVTSKERKRVYISLYQLHLPKMDDTNTVEYNKPRGKISKGKNFHTVAKYLNRSQTQRHPNTVIESVKKRIESLFE